jgi:hypothetical protein
MQAQKHRQHGDGIRPHLFLQNKESKLKREQYVKGTG